MQKVELYLIVILTIILIVLIVHTTRYYRGEKRKVKNLHRFANEGEVEAQLRLAECYEKGIVVKKDPQKAAFWRQKAIFSVDRRAKGAYRDILRIKRNQKKQ